MECAVCKRKLTEADKPLLFDVHDIQADGELKTGYRIALCPPSLEGKNCEAQFRTMAERRNMTLIPLVSPESPDE